MQQLTNATSHQINQASSDGGALYIKRRSFAFLTNTSFKYDKAISKGGAILIQHSVINIETCTFESESAMIGNGGSICVENVGNVSITDSKFLECKAFTGGSISVETESIINIKHSAVYDSFSNSTGAGFYITHNSILAGYNLNISGSKSNSGSGISMSVILVK